MINAKTTMNLEKELLKVLETDLFMIQYRRHDKDKHSGASMAQYFARSEEEAIGKFFKEFGSLNILKIDNLTKIGS